MANEREGHRRDLADHHHDRRPSCRYCFEIEGPGGLQDILIQPCACSGTVGHAHVSCLYRWQLAKMEQLRDVDRCEVCQQPYAVPPGARRALVAAGQLPALPRGLRLWHTLARLSRAVSRLVRPFAGALEAAVGAVLAADYALQAVRMTPSVLANPALLRPYKYEFLTAVATMFVLPVALALRVDPDDAAAQRRRLRQGVALQQAFLLSSATVATYLPFIAAMDRLAADPRVPEFWRQDAASSQALAQGIVAVALPVAAAFVGACSAWWRMMLLPLDAEGGIAAFCRACGRVGAAAELAARHAGLLPWLQAAWAAVAGSAAGRWAGASAARAAAAAGTKRQGSLEGLLRRIEAASGLDAAGAFSA